MIEWLSISYVNVKNTEESKYDIKSMQKNWKLITISISRWQSKQYLGIATLSSGYCKLVDTSHTRLRWFTEVSEEFIIKEN